MGKREREREFMDNSLIVNNSEKQRERDWVYRLDRRDTMTEWV